MPRKLTEKMPLDEFEDEILFTEAALAADPDAEDLLKVTAGWLGLVDLARAKDRELRRLIANTDAARIVADGRLDHACVRFGDELVFVLGKDREHPRFKQFFDLPVSRFVKTSLARQIARVRSWLGSNDEVLKKHKTNLETWVGRADQALVQTRGLSLKRGESQVLRLELAEDVTRERDGLEEMLAARAREKNLGRDWPKAFFRTGVSGGGQGSGSADAEGSATTDAG